MTAQFPGRPVRRRGAPRGRWNRSPLAPARGAAAAPPSGPPPRGTGSRGRCACAANVEPGAPAGTVRGEAQTSKRNARRSSSHSVGRGAALGPALRRGGAALPGLACSVSPGGRGRRCRPGNGAGGGVTASVQREKEQGGKSCHLAAPFRRRSRVIPYLNARHGDAGSARMLPLRVCNTAPDGL